MAHLLDPPGTCRVLVVDDDNDAADALVEMLRLWGFSAHAVYDGDQAVLAEESLQPSLILLDIGLPRLDGYAAATVIRGGSTVRPVKLVALTGRASDADRVVALSVGFDEHVSKPIGRAKLHMLALEVGPATRRTPI